MRANHACAQFDGNQPTTRSLAVAALVAASLTGPDASVHANSHAPSTRAAARAFVSPQQTDSAHCSPPTRAQRAVETDDQITAAVVDELGDDPSIEPGRVHVRTASGIVVLSGSTDDVLAARRAVRHAELVRGVRDVIDRIEVTPPAVADEVLAQAVRHALYMDPATDSYRLEVSADHGVVTLTGIADSFQGRQLAVLVAEGVAGVSKVADRIALRPPHPRSDSEIEADVVDRLRWDMRVNVDETRVSVADGTVRLEGRVGTQAERRRAYSDAWVTGTKDVDASQLYVSPALADPRRGEAPATVSDEDIAAALRTALEYDPRVRTGDVHVRVADAVATLEGRVPTLKAKRAAEQDARDTVGVIGLDNLIAVAPRSTKIEEREIEQAALTALAVNPRTAGLPIGVEARDDLVVLHGSVPSQLQRAHAEDVVAGVLGVRDVENDLRVNTASRYVRNPYLYPYEPYGTAFAGQPGRSDAEIERTIERKLQASPFVDAYDVHACVDHGRATLTGFAADRRAYEAATRLALEAGAVSVDNELGFP